MVKKKASGITLFAALVMGLSSSHFVSAKNDISSISEYKGEGKIRSGNSEGKSNGIDITKLLAFGIGTTGLTAGAVLAVDKNSGVSDVSLLNSKIKELEGTIEKLTQEAATKIGELEKYKPSGEQTTVKQGTNPLAIVMYVCVCLAMVAILASIL